MEKKEFEYTTIESSTTRHLVVTREHGCHIFDHEGNVVGNLPRGFIFSLGGTIPAFDDNGRMLGFELGALAPFGTPIEWVGNLN